MHASDPGLWRWRTSLGHENVSSFETVSPVSQAGLAHVCVCFHSQHLLLSFLSLRVTVLVVSEGSSFILIVTLSTGRRQLAFCHGSVLISVLRLYNDTLDSPTCAFGNACTRVLLGVCLGIDCDRLGPRAQARPA